MNLAKKFQAFLDSNGVQYLPGRQSFITDCVDPSCGKPRHMYIRKVDGQSICFKCGTKWHWKRLVSDISGCSIEQAYNTLHGHGGGDVISQENPLDKDLIDFFDRPSNFEEKIDLGNPIVMGPDFVPYHKSGKAMEYLDFRGVRNRDLLDLHDVRYHAGMNAVVFPIVVPGISNVWGWQARKIDPKENEPKSITMPGFDKSKFLMARGYYWSRLVLVEGPFDLLHVEAVEGITGAASMGKVVSQDQLKLIIDSPAKEIYIGLDEDAAEQVYEVVDAIGLHKKCFRIKPPRNKDFGDCTPKEINKAMEKALLTTAMFLEVYLKEV